MNTRPKIMLTGLIAAITMLVATSGASASNLSVNSTSFYLIWDELQLQNAFTEPVECEVTLLGSFHSLTIPKVDELLIGAITHAEVDDANCVNGGTTVLNETLPWHVRYGGFTGSLPNITTITQRLIGASFNVEVGGIVECLITTERSNPALGIINLEGERAASVEAEATIPIVGRGFFCELASPGGFSGTAAVEDGEGGDVDFSLIRDPPSTASLTAAPSGVVVTGAEQNDVFRVRNVGDATATSISPEVVAEDEREPEFELRSPTCTETLAPGESCTYTVVVNSRPEADGRVRIAYYNGSTTTSTAVDVDIES